MSTSATYPTRARTQPGSSRAILVTAGAVIALATAVAGIALLAGIATGSAIEAPNQPGTQFSQPIETPSSLTSAPSFD